MKPVAPILILFLLLSLPSHAESPADISGLQAKADSLVAFAEYLRSIGEPFSAVTECKRALFAFPASVDRSAACRCASFALAELGETEEAIRFARLAVRAASDDAERAERRLDLAAVLIAFDYSGTAVVELVPLTASEDPSVAGEAQLMLALAHLGRGQWERTRDALRVNAEIARTHGLPVDEERLAGADSILAAASATPPKSEDLAVFLSTLVPGLGQLYAGHPLEAAHSAALNAGLGYWTYVTAVEGTVLESAMGPFPWLLRYYMGGRYWAKVRAGERNAADRRRVISEVLSVMRLEQQ